MLEPSIPSFLKIDRKARNGHRSAYMRELQSRAWIICKGVLFLVLGVLSAMLLLLIHPAWSAAALLALIVWSCCRFYYFCFYVIERYVDSRYRFSGLLSA